MGTGRLQADLGDVIIQVSFWTSALFPWLIGRFVWRWWKADDRLYGIALMSLDLLLAAAFLLPVAELDFSVRPTQAWQWASIAVVALIPARTWLLGWTLYRIQSAGRAAGATQTGALT